MDSRSGDAARALAARIAADLSNDRRVRLVVLFGSAVDRKRETVGDVDVAVLARPGIPFEELLRRIATQSQGSGLSVDLVDLSEAPPVLANEVADAGETLFARTPEDEVEFVTRARARFWDFKPYLDEQSRLIRERQKERLRGSPP